MKLHPLAQSLLLVGIGVHAGWASAQSQTAADRQQLEKVVVTGSSIKRIASEGALPMQTISRAEIDRAGIVSAEQLIMDLSTNGNGLDNLASNADVVGGAQRGNNGATSANLRNQGSNATLILLNGRRVASHGLNGGQVDLNQIPFSAVERVEVLKDGASAIYGTDAIGGVINFILRNDFQGVNLRATADVTEAGGGNIFRGSVVGGYGNLTQDGFNVMAALAVTDHKALKGSQRDFVNTFQPERGLSVDTRGTPYATIFPLAGTLFPTAASTPLNPNGTVQQPNYSGGINVLDLPGQAGCSSVPGMAPYDERLWDAPSAALACAWDTGKAAVLQQPVTNTNLVARGTLDVGEHRIALEITASKSESAKRFSDLQMTPNTTTQQLRFPRNADSQASYDRVFDALRAAFPTTVLESQRGLPLAYRWRCTACGPREIETETDTQRFFLGADGPLFAGWDYRTGIMKATSESQSTLGGGYYFRGTNGTGGSVPVDPANPSGPQVYGIIQALNSGKVDVFSPTGQISDAGKAELERASARGTVLYGGEFTVEQADFSATGPVFKLPAGDALAAVGVDYRVEKYKFNGDARAANNRPVIVAAPFDDGNALSGVERKVKAVYGELMLPVIKGTEFTAAWRRDDYDGFGVTTNPKFSIRSEVVRGVLVRASYSTGFRVPTFNQLFNGISESQYTGADLADPEFCPGGRVDSTNPRCGALRPIIVNGGKADLGPEEADMRSAGLVLQPNPHFSASLDWWSIEREGTIQLLGLRTLLENYSLFRGNFARDSGGNLVAIDQRWVNAGETATEGVEVGLRGSFDAWGARWTTGLDGTYLLKKKSRVLKGVPFGPSEIGQFSFSGDLGLRWKHNAFVTYKRDAWSATLSQTYRDGYRNQELPGVTSGRVTPTALEKKVKEYVTYNATLSYTGFKGFTLTGLVKNLFDKDPPFAINYDSNFGSGSSWEPRVADPRGRSYVVTVDYSF